MIILLACLISYFAFYLLYLSSDKQKKVIVQSRWAFIAKKPPAYKTLAVTLCITAFILLAQDYGYSVAFITWWVFATPLIFLLILRNNPLKSKK
ncbi:DUF1634 domain-containing protein [Acinetobacter rathckeae]|uniref:DUF1634 domain-containing protein n=1 Tax=Acinetobacter rathckeae TaxID=2605272 RepID=UPI0018A29FF5|nr:DUF1634 domain-containing protein [Acinetobacter rathckeae]MBF7686980.1 DUF1634 domain-containing protein [Acinetobacter rathckeae]MBF7694616.1 DUF1634 domain-containing protein [Acinetobacter rathckeae]